MVPQPDTLAQTPSDDVSPQAGEEAERTRVAARHLAMLQALAEAAFEVALSLKDQITAPQTAGDDAAAPRIGLPELALAFSRASRAVRTTIALHAKLVVELRPPADAEPAPRQSLKVVFVDGVHCARCQARVDDDGTEDAPRPVAQSAVDRTPVHRAPVHKTDVTEVVRRVAAACLLPGEHSPRDAAAVVDHRAREAAERLDEHDDLGPLLRRPLSEVVDHICREIGLNPDWPRLAEEAWAQEEMAGGQVGAPLKALSPLKGERVGSGGDVAVQPPEPQPPDPYPAARSP